MPAPSRRQSLKGFSAVTLHPERCLNSYHHGAGCTLCADSCPVEGTIAVIDGTPILDEGACLQCGLCLHLCPTGCFSQEGTRIDGLKRSLANLPPGPVDLLCPRHPHPDRGPSSLAVQTEHCLAQLSAATLLELAAGGRELRLDDSPCSECRLGGVHRYLEQTVTETGAWGSLLEGSGQVSLQSREARPEPAEERAVHDASRPLLSRRDLFGAVKRAWPPDRSFEHAGALSDPGRSDRAGPASTAQLLPPQRARLLAILRTSRSTTARPAGRDTERDAESRPGLPIAEVTIEPDRCSACGLCARTCPTAAIAFTEDRDGFQLTFQASHCLGLRCNLCQQVCPEAALATKPAAADPAWLAATPRELAAGRLIPCKTCGAPVAARPNRPPTCFACRSIPTKADFSKSLKWSKG